MKGMFITFEGIEGSGKSTQISLLANHLQSRHQHVVVTREPGGTPIGDQVRRILLDPSNAALDPTAELLLYAAARAQHLCEVIGPGLAAGGIVLCDRFSDATLAYQGYGRGLDRDVIRAIDRIVTAEMRPDLTLLFDIEAADGVARAHGRNRSRGLEAEARFENEEISFHERVRQGYLELRSREPDRIRVVDARPSPDRVQHEVRSIVDGLLASVLSRGGE